MLLIPPVAEHKHDPDKPVINTASRKIYIYNQYFTNTVEFTHTTREPGIPTEGKLMVVVNTAMVGKCPQNMQGHINFNKPLQERISFIKSYYAFLLPAFDYTEKVEYHSIPIKPILNLSVGLTNTDVISNKYVSKSRYLITQIDYLSKQIFSLMDTSSHAVGGLMFLYMPDPISYYPLYSYRVLADFRNKLAKSSGYTYDPYITMGSLFDSNTQLKVLNDNSLVEKDILNSLYNTESKKLTRYYRLLHSVMVEMIKVSIRGLFDEFALIYDSKKGTNIPKYTFPFTITEDIKEELISFLSSINLEFEKLCDKLTTKIGEVYIILHVSDMYHTIKCIFKEEKGIDGKPLTIIFQRPKLMCIKDFNSTMYHPVLDL